MATTTEETRPVTKMNMFLFNDDIEYLQKQGYKIATIVRKIVSDYVIYHKVKIENKIKEFPEDQ